MSAALDPDKLRRALGDCVIGRQIVVLKETTSTNDSVLHRAGRDTSEGLVVFAEHQTAGRGQRSNRWESTPGKGLCFSILLRPKIEITESSRLTIWAAEIIAETIQREFALAPTIKEPNDVQIDGRKVAGVLVEMRAQPRAPHIAIAGIGINVNHVLEDFPDELRSRAISIAMALHRAVDRNRLAVALLRNLDRSYQPGTRPSCLTADSFDSAN
jgi:BirA family transcriptional regulator, biotin operon repressor / biotin---[acetyl-CoA-carboxylase] ligase